MKDIDNIIVRDVKAVWIILWIVIKFIGKGVLLLLRAFVPLVFVWWLLFYAYDIVKLVAFILYWVWYWNSLNG